MARTLSHSNALLNWYSIKKHIKDEKNASLSFYIYSIQRYAKGRRMSPTAVILYIVQNYSHLSLICVRVILPEISAQFFPAFFLYVYLIVTPSVHSLVLRPFRRFFQYQDGKKAPLWGGTS